MIHATNGSSQAVHNSSAFDNLAKPASQPRVRMVRATAIWM